MTLNKSTIQWWRYTRARQVKWPGRKIHHPASSPGSALPGPAYCFASVIVWTENKNVTISDRFICFILTVKRCWLFWWRQLKKGRQLFLRKKVHPGDLAGGFSDIEMTWLLYCAGAATGTIWHWSKCSDIPQLRRKVAWKRVTKA